MAVLVDDARYFPVVISPTLATHTPLMHGMVMWWLLGDWDLTFDLYAQYTCLMCDWQNGSVCTLGHSWCRGETLRVCI